MQTILSHAVKTIKSHMGSNLYQRCFTYHRNLSTNSILPVKEIKIPIPYGTVAAKAWGKENAYPVLAFHGWLDNCGTFDKLIPLLSDKFYYIAIDAPGQGRSSHQPPGSVYTDIEMMMHFKRVVEYFEWKKFNIIGHSLGGIFALLFSSIFPDLVNKVAVIDVIKPPSASVDLVPDIKINGLNQLLQIEEKLKKNPPVYTPESAITRLIKGMHGEIDEEGAEILLKRGTKISDCGKGIVFTRDMRFKPIEFISMRSHDTIEHFMSALRCELLVILATKTHPFYFPEEPETVTRFLDFYAKNIEGFVLEHVEGNHFVHLNNPERVAPIINKFLLAETNKK
ncbi:serine hydrolase-like protein [Nephila pilipes]|uniref:Serine hydrolase-like protein n=1 Tax=Nephila pilipes TaxID=299642 RepID=A0A8X6MLY5_NEPPI|nr:serine hydrolase-like protein [Nephila pilipes]